MAQLAQNNPALVRGIGAALVVGVVAAGATIAIPGQGDGTAAGPQPPPARSAEPGPAPFPVTSPTSSLTPGPAVPGNPAIPGSPAVPGNPVIPGGPAAPGNSINPGGSAATPAPPTPTAAPGQPGGPGPTPTSDPDRPAPPDPPTVPASWGFAFVRWPDDPIGASHDLSAANPESNWTYGLWRLTSPPPSGKPTVTHLAVGKHRVRLPGIGVPGGIVHVTATDFSAAGSFCQPSGWEQDGADEVIDVACFDSTGRFADVPFGIVFTAGTADNPLSPRGVRGFVYNNRPTAATFTPDPIYRRNMGAVTRLGTGRYTVAVPDSGEAVQISPVGTAARHCTIADRRTATVEVARVAHGGSPADTAFTLSYAGGQNLLDDRRADTGNYLISTDAPSAGAPSVSRSWSSGGRPVTLARQSTGQYEIHFPAGLLPSSTHVTATGGGYCNMPLRNDYSQPDNVIIRIACFTATDERSNSGFHLIYMSARI